MLTTMLRYGDLPCGFLGRPGTTSGNWWQNILPPCGATVRHVVRRVRPRTASVRPCYGGRTGMVGPCYGPAKYWRWKGIIIMIMIINMIINIIIIMTAVINIPAQVCWARYSLSFPYCNLQWTTHWMRGTYWHCHHMGYQLWQLHDAHLE